MIILLRTLYILALSFWTSGVHASEVLFSNVVATYTENLSSYDYWPPSQMIDGITTGKNGWSIARSYEISPANPTLSETALFTIAQPLTAGTASIDFTIYQNYGGSHLLGDFSLGYTTDASPTLTSLQTLLSITGASSQNGTTFTYPSIGEILAGGPLPSTDVYSISAIANSSLPITGIFLNLIDNPNNGLGTGGPGRQPDNGNVAITEFTVSANVVPVPGAVWLFGTGLLGVLGLKRRKQ